MIRKIVIAAACLLFGSTLAFAASSPAPMTGAVTAVHADAAPVLMPVVVAVAPDEAAIPLPMTRDVALSEPMQLPPMILAKWGDDDGGPVWEPTWLCPWRPLKPWDWCL